MLSWLGWEMEEVGPGGGCVEGGGICTGWGGNEFSAMTSLCGLYDADEAGREVRFG